MQINLLSVEQYIYFYDPLLIGRHEVFYYDLQMF